MKVLKFVRHLEIRFPTEFWKGNVKKVNTNLVLYFVSTITECP